MKFPRSSSSRSRTSAARNGTPWENPVAQTTRSAGSTRAVVQFGERQAVPGEEPADGPVAVHGDAAVGDALEEPLGGEPDRAPDDVLHLPGRHQAEILQAELPYRRPNR